MAGLKVGPSMNSQHPSSACPPLLAAWFFKHSLYDTTADVGDDGAWRWLWIILGCGVGGVSVSESGALAGAPPAVVELVVRSIAMRGEKVNRGVTSERIKMMRGLEGEIRKGK